MEGALMTWRFLGLLTIALTPVTPQGDDSPAIRHARQAPVREIDPALPRISFDEWLHGVVGRDAVITWETNDCGEQTGNPTLDRGRDFPVCAEARSDLGARGVLRVSLIVGSVAKGVSGIPGFYMATLDGPGGPPHHLRTLPQVRAVVQTAPLDSAEFEKYPGEPLFRGKPAAPQMQLARARQFRTVLRLAAAEGPNFNGRYHVVRWGCGTACLEWAVVDLSNGRVWFASERSELCHAPDEPPDAFKDWPPRIEARIDSRLLYLNECSRTGGVAERALDIRRVYEWRRGASAPVLLRTEPFVPQPRSRPKEAH
jgi:hypothetical protein